MDCQSSANATIDIGELSGTTGSIVGTGSLSPTNTTWRVGFKNTSVTFAGTIANAVNITKVGTGTWTLTGANSYTGLTTISNGVLALGDGVTDGSIGGSSFINITANAFLSTALRSDGTFSPNTGSTLGGNGKLLGSLSLANGGTVMPGSLSVTNAVSLSGGTTVMQINRSASPNSAKLICSNTITLGGTLVVSNVGPALQVGDTFVLFSTPLAGTFAGSVVLPSFYAWNTNNLEVNGTISVTGVIPPPKITSIDASGLAGGTLVFNATGGLASEPFVILTSTNLLTPANLWTTAASGNFDPSGNLTSFSVTGLDPTLPQSYYRLQAQ
jgi:autotransporter-associated beta strand protein